MSKKYTADTISINTNLDHVRARPTAYIGSKDNAGQAHMISELISNSVDELVLRPEGGTIYMCLWRDTARDSYQFFISDNGRGIPVDRLTEVMTILGASGKMSNSSYRGSAGLFGMGAKVAAALSKHFRAISRNENDGGVVGSLELKDSKIVTFDRTNDDIPVGTYIAFEPDLKAYFNEGEDFMTSGYLLLTAMCKKLNIFNENINFQFYIYDTPLPGGDSVWSLPASEFIRTIQYVLQSPTIVEYASDKVDDKAAYLFEIWRITSDVVYRDTIIKPLVDENDRLSYDLRMFLVKTSQTAAAQFLISVNNVNLPDKTNNSVSQSFMSVLRSYIAEHFNENADMKKYILEDYRFPTLLFAANVQYNGAEFSGATKSSFNDDIFAKYFSSTLMDYFASKPQLIEQLVRLLTSNITNSYNNFRNIPMKKSDYNKVFVSLNFASCYRECKSTNAAECELIIVEGESASVSRVRDNNYQAVYATRGKPLNAALGCNDIADYRRKILQDPVYQDLMRILNINVSTTDMSQARFGKIIIATDADADGNHIRSLHVNNFYIINPRIVESGMVWLANPPLYSMDVSATGKLHLRDKVALYDARIEFIYRQHIEITIRTCAGETELTGESYRDFCYLVHHLGELFTVVSQQLAIPILLLERLAMFIHLIHPVIQYEELEKQLRASIPDKHVKLKTNPVDQTLTVSIGSEDHHVNLRVAGAMIVNELLRMMKKYCVHEITPIVRTKNSDTLYSKPTVVSLMLIYTMFEKLDNIFKVSRYKGLGELSDQDCIDSIMNPITRSITQITDIGDPLINMGLMNKKDSSMRKQLITDSSVLAPTFRSVR